VRRSKRCRRGAYTLSPGDVIEEKKDAKVFLNLWGGNRVYERGSHRQDRLIFLDFRREKGTTKVSGGSGKVP